MGRRSAEVAETNVYADYRSEMRSRIKSRGNEIQERHLIAGKNASTRLQWSSSGAHRELCYLKGRSEDECQNYVRVFGRQGPDRFLVCGTNAYKPLCRQFTIKRVVMQPPPCLPPRNVDGGALRPAALLPGSTIFNQ
ncbi:hypothetical protein KM043_003689 [Ampulex compressa]|nr:hypothetical protein KM043_003689 [Ampulex compressa]